MKKMLLVLAVLAMFGASSLSALELGVGFKYGSEIEELGLQVNAVFPITKALRVAPDIAYYFVEGDTTYMTFNLNLQYCFLAKDAIAVYGLAGLQLAYMDNDFFGSDSALGLNLGAGVQYNFTAKVGLFVEAKYTISDWDQFALAFGVRFKL